MPDAVSEPPASQPDNPSEILKHFVYGAIPAAVAALVLLIQGLTTAVPNSHRGILYVIAVVGAMASATVLLWCTSIRIKERFEKHADAQDVVLAETHRIVNRLDRSNQALHRKLDQACEERQGLLEEVDHLRRLVVQDVPSIGPSEYS